MTTETTRTRRTVEAPFFSICIPQYDRTSFLIEVCRSLDAQTFRGFEVCISDDRSPDGRQDELLRFLESSGLSYVYKMRDVNGRYDANLRSAMDLAIGTYLFLLGNDDALKGPATLEVLHGVLAGQPSPVDVALTNFEDFSTGAVTRRVTESHLSGSGPRLAAAMYRRFSFVSGVMLRRDAAVRERTTRWDGSEMYQMYIGCRLIAAGGLLLESDVVAIRKDLQIPGETVDSYARKPHPRLRGIPAQVLPIHQLARLVLDAIEPYAAPVRSRAALTVVTQFLGFLCPFWIFEYRRVRSWRYAAGFARAMRPRHSLEGARVPFLVRMVAVCLYSGATLVGLGLPLGASRAIYAPARRWARRVGEWGAVVARS